MKLKSFFLAVSLLFSTASNAGYYPWGWNGWIPSVSTISAAPTSGVQLGSVVSAQDTEALYIWTGSSWQEISGGGGGGVTSLNSLTGALTLVEGTGITITPSGSNITISSSGSSYTFADSIVNSSGTVTLVNDSASPGDSKYYGTNASGTLGYFPIPNPSPSYSGTVTAVSVVSANGFDGTVANATTTPAITLETSITGLLHGNGTAISAETVSSPLVETTGTLSCNTASGSQAGCLASSDWTAFNGKQAALSFTAPLVDTSNTVTCNVASGSQPGCLASADWTTFNNKSPAGNYATSGSGDVSWSAPTGPGAVTTSLVATTNSTLATLSGLITASSLATVGTIATGVWHGTAVTPQYGGTGLTSVTSGNLLLGAGTSTMTLLAPSANGNVVTDTGSTFQSQAPASASSSSTNLLGLGLSASTGSSAMTVNLTQPDGSSNPSSGNPVYIGIRNSTATTGGYAQRSVTSSLSLAIPHLATLGQVSGATETTYIYAQDNSGTIQLCASTSGYFDQGVVQTSTAISTSSSGRNVLYCTSAVTGGVRLIGSFISSQTVAGVWASNPSQISVLPTNYASVTSSGPGQYRTEYLTFGGSTAGSSCTGTCLVYGTSGSWASVVRNSTGDYTLNIVSNEFSSIPACMVNVNNATGGFPIAGFEGTSTSTAQEVTCRQVSNQANQDCNLSVICMGPH